MSKKFETLSQQSKKKKDFLIVASIIGIIGFLVFSATMSIMSMDKEKKFKIEKEKEEKDKVTVIPEKELKESWAVSIENTINKQGKKLDNFISKSEEARKKDVREIKDIVFDSIVAQDENIKKSEKQTASHIKKIEKELKKKLEEQDAKIEEIFKRAQAGSVTVNVSKKDGNRYHSSGEREYPTPAENEEERRLNEILGLTDKNGTSESPTPEENNHGEKNPPLKLKPKKEFKKFKLKALEVSNAKYFLEIKKRKLRELKRRIRSKKSKAYHVMLGFTQAYMITGAYAPIAQNGQSEPLPVLLEAEGDIIIANHDRESIDKCLIIGSAKGNMATQKADIRLVKISCSINGGKKKIEGPISGWVIGEDSIPGVQGELLHKNGAWMARTFVAGFLQSFSQAIGSSGTQTVINGNTGVTTSTVTQSAKNSLGNGAAQLFTKVGDYYLKMAEQIFPVVSVKGGRTVNIVLKGGEDLTMTDLNGIDVEKAEEDALEEEIAQLEKEAAEEEMNSLGEIQTKKQKNKEI